MQNKKFEKVYNDSCKLTNYYLKKDYETYFSSDSRFKNLDDYIKYVNELSDKKQKKKIDENKDVDSHILKQCNIQIEDIRLDIFSFWVEHTQMIDLDDDYNVVEHEPEILYQTGAIVSYEEDKGFWNIENLFTTIVKDKKEALKNYKELCDFLLELSYDDLFIKIQEEIDKETRKLTEN